MRKGRKGAKHYIFRMIWGSGGLKSRLAKTAVAEPTGQTRDEKLYPVVTRRTSPNQNVQNTSASDHFWKLRRRKSARRCDAKQISKSKCIKHLIIGPLLEVKMSKKCTPLWLEAHFEVKMYKALRVRTIFGNWDVEKVHAVVARSTFRSQNIQSTRGSDHFWKLRCRKCARRCGVKQISKSKCINYLIIGSFLEVTMSKKCTPLWREAHFEVKMYKALRARTIFGSWDVEKVHVVVARSTFRNQNIQNTWDSDHFWKLRCRKSARRCGAKQISKSKCINHLIIGPLLEVTTSKKCMPLWREAHFEIKMYKALRVRIIFGNWDVEKVHAVVARSTFRSQNIKNTRGSDPFWKLRCRKRARRCGAKQISKSKCINRLIIGPLLEVTMSKKCTSLWREAHFEINMLKISGVRTIFRDSNVASLH